MGHQSIPSKREENQPLTSVAKAFDIIESIKEMDGAGVSEIADHLNLPKSTVHSHLKTLSNRGYVIKKGAKYEVGLRFINLGRHACHGKKYELVAEKVDEIAESTGERTQFLVEQAGFGIYVFKTTPPGGIKPGDWINERRTSLHASAAGKAILAHYPERYTNEIISRWGLKKLTDNAHTDIDTFHTELRKIREMGYAVNCEEHVEGIRSVGVPIFESDNSIFGAIGVSAPTERMKGKRFEEEIPAKALAAANDIKLELIYSSNSSEF